jgi:hypothetical protein
MSNGEKGQLPEGRSGGGERGPTYICGGNLTVELIGLYCR